MGPGRPDGDVVGAGDEAAPTPRDPLPRCEGSRLRREGLGWERPSEELAAIFFTSGTTGNPKGCMITHANLTSQIEAAGDIIPLDSSCRLASILPLSHLFEMTCGLLYPIARGAAIHYVPSRRGPDILRVFQEQQITHMVAVPQLLTIMGQTLDGQLREKLPKPAYDAMIALADRLPFAARRTLFLPIHKMLGGKLRLFGAGGAALPPETQRLWERMGIQVVQGYGTSECSPLVAGSSADGSTPIGSVGQADPRRHRAALAGGRAAGPRPERHARLLERPGAHRRGAHRTAGTRPATWPASTSRATSSWPAARRS